MRLLSLILFALALTLAALALYAYLFLQGMGCAYALRSTDCGVKWPWELSGEDVVVLIVLPWSVVTIWQRMVLHCTVGHAELHAAPLISTGFSHVNGAC